MGLGVFWRPVGSLVLMSIAWTEASAQASDEFDRSVLEARGIDPNVAEYFRSAARFAAGRNRVSLNVNGVPSGQIFVTFDDEGQLCVDANLFEHVGIAAPSNVNPGVDEALCLSAVQALAGFRVQLDPGQNLVSLVVPADLLARPGQRPGGWDSGGVAGVWNYDALVIDGSAAGQSSHYRSLGTELGFNAGDWVVRSRQNYTSFQGVTRFETLYTQASKTWERFGAQVQLGQLNMRSSLFSTGPFTGVQIFPETALSADAGGLGAGSEVQGLAYSTARVEVRQSAIVIYTTLVPPGPFTLRDLPLISDRLDLEVGVFEESGERRDFHVPAAQVRPARLGTLPSYGLAAGRIRQIGRDHDTPSFFAASRDWRWGPRTQTSAGWMGADGYQSFGWGVSQALTPATVLTLQQLGSRTTRGIGGQEIQATLNTTLGDGLSVGLTAGQRSSGFRYLSEAGRDAVGGDPFARAANHWSLSLRRADPAWGALSGSLARYQGGGGKAHSRVSAAWSRGFDWATFSLSLEHDRFEQAGRSGAFVNVGVPLGRNRRISTSVRYDDSRGVRSGARYSEQVSDSLGYSIGADRFADDRNDFNARLNAVPRYTSAELGYSQSSAGARHYDLTLRGGLALHDEGVTPSPYPLRDTFGLLKVGDYAGVKIGTPQGPVWTDGAGRAVAAELPPYQASRVEIDTVSLPRNIEVPNGYQEVRAARGAVPRLDFQAARVRRLLLYVRNEEGVPMAKGLGVYDHAGEYLTTVVDTGLVYLEDAPVVAKLSIALADEQICRLEIDTRQMPASSAPIDRLEVACQVG
ncbi:fimbria/pilus outer membrane usher protein [Pseudomonas sp. R1-6]|uniref:fimbria/pilus outer membrane usher protein n=1 Tax=Pseudomonas sp. R1-6 TaxID=2817397 RepID=UPI003DAA4360